MQWEAGEITSMWTRWRCGTRSRSVDVIQGVQQEVTYQIFLLGHPVDFRFSFCSDQDKWMDLAPMLQKRGKLGLVGLSSEYDSSLLAIGGVSGFRQSDNLNTIER